MAVIETPKSNKKPSSKKTEKTIDAKVVSEQKSEKTGTSQSENTTQNSVNLNIDNKTLILLAHILGLVTSFVAPLIVYLITEDKLVKQHATAALNFQISVIIYGVILTVAGSILTVVTFGLFLLIQAPLYLVLGTYAIIPPIIAAIRANEDIKKVYEYPFILKLVK